MQFIIHWKSPNKKKKVIKILPLYHTNYGTHRYSLNFLWLWPLLWYLLLE